MSTKQPRLVQYGMGVTGREIVRQLADKGLSVVGVIDTDTGLCGRDVGEVAGLAAPLGIPIRGDAAACLAETGPDVVLHATAFDLPGMLAQLTTIAEAGANAISLTGINYPWRRYPDFALALDEIAKTCGVTFLGTGNIPGFLTDVLPIAVTGGCHRITAIELTRVSDFTPWGQSVFARYGLGASPDEFRRGIEAGEIHLFSNLWQSLDMITAALGWELPESEEEREPYTSDRPRRGTEVEIASGQVGGFRHCISESHPDGRCVGLEVRGFVDPKGEEESPMLNLRIVGEPGAEVIFRGEIVAAKGSLLTSCARLINAIPFVSAAPAGLVGLNDLPAMAAFRSAGV